MNESVTFLGGVAPDFEPPRQGVGAANAESGHPEVMTEVPYSVGSCQSD